ncbi:acyl-CoA thioesterase [Brevundimonas staleyi]|uniref:Acyl-CoA thioesterase n=1 Tax=Brevundimonas staleyi TaxID=74326 RepID=A0ABW0FQ26_9CAUL
MAETFTTQIRVRWGEVDAQGVVFNPNYFVYADVAATEFFRAAGVMTDTYPDMGQSYVVDARASFRASARFDDLMDIEVSVPRIGRSSYELRVDIRRGEELLTEVSLTYVRAVNGKSEALSEPYREMLARVSSAG